MKIELKKNPKNPTIIEGFPCFGFVSSISTEFLIKHLDAKKIGSIYSDKLDPIAAIHDKKVIDPIEIYYDKKHNLVILRVLTKISGVEWAAANIVEKLSKKLKAKEIISLEGVASEKEEEEPKSYFYTTIKDKEEKLKGIKDLDKIKEGIITGVTGALILTTEKRKLPLSCIFVKSHPGLPDSRAASKIIKILDDYLGLNVDYKPLLKTAKEFEKKLKKLISQKKKSADMKEKKAKSYLG